MTLAKRLAALERARGPTDPALVIVRGGLCDFDDTRATVGDAEISRGPGEPFQSFQARAMTAAKAGDERFVIIGGLPD